MASIPSALLKHLSKRNIGIGSALNAGASVYFGVDAYQTAREEGHGVAVSAAKAAGEFALPMVMGTPLYLAFDVLPELPGAALQAYNAIGQRKRELGKQNMGGAFSNSQFNDTQQAFTMRQAGQAIAERSRYNIKQAQMGNEAKYMMK